VGPGAAGALFALELLRLGEEAIEFLFVSLITEYLAHVSPRVHEIEYALLRAPARIVWQTMSTVALLALEAEGKQLKQLNRDR
jgi:hypothetical protein